MTLQDLERQLQDQSQVQVQGFLVDLRLVNLMRCSKLHVNLSNSEKKLKKIEHVDDIFDTFTLFVPVVLVSDKMEGMDTEEEVDMAMDIHMMLDKNVLDHRAEVH